ncbi:MAG: response regulator [Nitrospinae bacterium]|nr:response regulator [Nitrospinota bacterium]
MNQSSRRPSALIVDDEPGICRNLALFLDKIGYSARTAHNGYDAVAAVKEAEPDLILLDVRMPGIDGVKTLNLIRALTHDAAVIMLTAVDDAEVIINTMRGGVSDYLRKPIMLPELEHAMASALEKRALILENRGYQRNLELKVAEQLDEISAGQLAIIFAMAKLSESRDPETGEHLERMCEYCRVLCVQLSRLPDYAKIITGQFITNMYSAAPLHDIGKVAIPDRILQKPGKLTAEEFEIMKYHTVAGAKTLRGVDARHPGNLYVSLGIEIAESHHEKWDGSGYPCGLAGERIPLPGRILALGDVYDALTSRRCYKEAFSHEQSRAIILEGKGTHFDPHVVDAFLARENEFQQVRIRYADPAVAPGK